MTFNKTREDMIKALQVGMKITPMRDIRNERIRHWTYASECARLHGYMIPGVELVVVEVGRIPTRMWVRVQIPTDPPKFLKISGDEYAENFRMLNAD